MTYRPPGTLGVLRVLARTSLLRIFRASRIQKQKREAKHGRNRRGATARKTGNGLAVLMVLMLPLFAFQSLSVTGNAVTNLAHSATDRGATGAAPGVIDGAAVAGRRPQRADHVRFSLLAEPVTANDPGSRALFARAGAVLLVVNVLVLLALAFGGANSTLAGAAWSDAWLMTFPVSTRSLTLAKALDYGLVQFFPWFTLFPMTWQYLRALGCGAALGVALLATVSTTLLIGSLRLWGETWLRLRFSLRALRNVQAACTMLAIGGMTVLFGTALRESVPAWFLDVCDESLDVAFFLPGGWPLSLPERGPIALVFGAGLTVVLFVVAQWRTEVALQGGSMRTGGVDAGARGKSANRWRRGRALGAAGKDVALLLRDRNFLVQTVVVPVFVLGLQMVLNPSLGEAKGKGVAMLAYGIGLYSLIGGCFQVLSAEGRALWMLYTLPVSVSDVVRRKTRIWAALATTFGVGALVVLMARTGQFGARFVLDLATVGVGTWCAAHIAAGISVIGCNPVADQVPRQPKVRHVYLYFFFAGIYFVGLASTEIAPRIGTAFVFATLAHAIWQRAADRLPWLLDPVEERRVEIGVYDGAAALIGFFALQALLFAIFAATAREAGTFELLLAFAIAGAITIAVVSAMLIARGVPFAEALALRCRSATTAATSVALGVLGGVGAGLLGLCYVDLVHRYDWFDLPRSPPRDVGFLVLAVVAAPIVEELLFRGLVFGGLLRSVRAPLAILWSAGLFAVVHPLPSWAPVFLVGVLAAALRWRTSFLPAAMALHAAYNWVILWHT